MTWVAMKISSGLVLALDVTDRSRALDVAARVAPHVDAVKVGYPLVLSCGTGIIGDLGKCTYVLCDFKVADIPNTSRLIASEAFKAGAKGIICHAFPGRESIAAVVDEAKRHGGDVLVVTEMSHPGALDFMAPKAEQMARMAKDSGASGIIAPATRPERVKALRAMVGDLLIVSPGVGAQGGTASQAISAGADAIIVGRSLYEAPDPAEAAAKLVSEIARARNAANELGGKGS
jgi:orotidine-5'-phosphate decarboxylase